MAMQGLIYFLRQIINLCHKEFIVIFKDPASRVVLIVPPLVQSLLFGYAATYDLSNVPYAVLDQSRGAASTQLLARLDGSGMFHRVATLDSVTQIADAIESGDALLVLQFGADFESRLAAGQAAALQLLLDGRNSTTAGTASAQIHAIVAAYNASRGTANPMGLTIETRAWYNPNLETRWNILPGLIAALSMMQTVMLAALSVAREREQGTFDQLLVTPYRPIQIMIGKAIPCVLVGLLQSGLVLMVARFWFGIPMQGGLFALTISMSMFTIATVGIGLSISALSNTMQQAMVYTFVLLMPLVLLSGLATPVRNMPDSLQIATYINPLRFAIALVRRVYLEGATLIEVWPNFIPFFAIALITLPLAAWLFRHRLA